ncbi:hypothetical protein [Marinoscillum sp.]|uniref:hypothetical protein n=1 Tax=Marinoscillum sp. TaxID=2024838 RepID=UPI003BAD5302
MSISPLLDSTIIFISNNDLRTRKLLHVIRRREVSRSVHWLRNLRQVERFFDNPLAFSKEPNHTVAIILDYDLEGVSLITRFLNDRDVLMHCTLFSLASVTEEVESFESQLRSAGHK